MTAGAPTTADLHHSWRASSSPPSRMSPHSEGCFRRIPRLDRRLHRSKQRLLSHQLQPSEVVMDSSQRVWLFSAVLLAFCCLANAVSVSHDGRTLIIDGQRRIIISGSIHYPRSTPEMWPDLIQKAKEGGLDGIETYVFWNAHEPRRREYNFEGHLDLIRFIKEIQNAGLYSILRIGPYVCAEWNYGGLPVWLWQTEGMAFSGVRTWQNLGITVDFLLGCGKLKGWHSVVCEHGRISW